MEKTRKEEIEKNVTEYVKTYEYICKLEDELKLLENGTAEAESLLYNDPPKYKNLIRTMKQAMEVEEFYLYKNRPKEYIKDMIRIVKQKEIEDSEDIKCSVALGNAYGDLLFEARLRLKHYDSYIEERRGLHIGSLEDSCEFLLSEELHAELIKALESILGGEDDELNLYKKDALHMLKSIKKIMKEREDANE